MLAMFYIVFTKQPTTGTTAQWVRITNEGKQRGCIFPDKQNRTAAASKLFILADVSRSEHVVRNSLLSQLVECLGLMVSEIFCIIAIVTPG